MRYIHSWRTIQNHQTLTTHQKPTTWWISCRGVNIFMQNRVQESMSWIFHQIHYVNFSDLGCINFFVWTKTKIQNCDWLFLNWIKNYRQSIIIGPKHFIPRFLFLQSVPARTLRRSSEASSNKIQATTLQLLTPTLRLMEVSTSILQK